ncbi:voltage-dependent T-type calcium channel subunit alpha-1G-like isoform X5 [Anopheles albimanus]|uniref:voltage-dependent T-type calcium channel subunit alpha-1G-like isoform X5 n=1 Tax=Anopheles albimanus TaxID=7167 RepID=UPI00163F03EE|nr:voltage-dependent T-type calcium channel subunit alpha-1G-like isoform X5 [Anopheles albimanus]
MKSATKESSHSQNHEPSPQQQRRQRQQQQQQQQQQQLADKHNYGEVIESLNLKNEKTPQPEQPPGRATSAAAAGRGSSAARSIRRSMGAARPVSSSSETTDTSGSSCSDGDSTSSSYDDPLPYPGFAEYSLKYLAQDTKPRIWCLQLITNPWFERISMLVILLNCITLGMYQPCVDDACVTNRCKILQIFDDIIFAFFSLEMTIKIVAMGGWGKGTYLADSWNRLDFFIVLAGALEYCLQVENLNLTAIRTIRVLRPLRAINRIPSMRILVMLLLDTLPMLGNVLLLCFFVFFIFGIVGVQLWEGILRQRCVIKLPDAVSPPSYLVSFYYEFSKEQDYICSKPEDSGMHLCQNLPPYRIGPLLCNESALPYSDNEPTATSCVNWNQYYTNCTQLGNNPFQGTISFDNIGLAWVAIFLVISLEGWTDIMYYVQDAHSFWDWIYFVLLIVIGSFFMINLCLVVIATQFSETKKREMERMRQERARFTSSSTLASSTNNSEPTTCYAEIVKYIGHLYRRLKRRIIKKLRLYKYHMQKRKEGLIPCTPETITLSPNKIKAHHPKCPRLGALLANASNTALSPHGRPSILQSSLSINKAGNQPNGDGATVGICGENQVSSPEVSEIVSLENIKNNALNNSSSLLNEDRQKVLLLKINNEDQSNGQDHCMPSLLSPPSAGRRRSSVMFNEYVVLHTPPTITEPAQDKNVYCVEKMTQAGDGSIWQVNLPHSLQTVNTVFSEYSDLCLTDAMTCQELLAFSVAFSAALPTGHTTLESFYTSLKRSKGPAGTAASNTLPVPVEIERLSSKSSNEPSTRSCFEPSTMAGINMEEFACCYEYYQNQGLTEEKPPKRSRFVSILVAIWRCFRRTCHIIRVLVKKLVDHKYFQQGILLAILINTLSMGIEYHDQPAELTAIVETSNIVFSAIFAVEMVLKVISEGPFRYVANGFNVFDGVIVILSVVELAQAYLGEGQGNSGLSVLRTFRLLRILKLVRFMPNLRRQLFVMLRTMDNVAIFFSLLILFIFIFSILGMYLFGGKFCKFVEESGKERECTCPEIVSKHPQCECDRKHFNNILWATVTVFQILTQEDWNVVLFNGMEKTSHWAALYFVTLMTFGNYVLFNLLVAILVEGFSSERNERREREQRELVKAKLNAEALAQEQSMEVFDDQRSFSESSTTDSYNGARGKWYSVEELSKVRNLDIKCNIQKQRLLQPNYDEAKNVTQKNRKEKDVSKPEPHSNKKRKTESLKLYNIQVQEPPIITTTAATPQDSPNGTMDSGASFKDWDQADFEKYERENSSLLKPPSVLGSLKALDDRAFFEGTPVLNEMRKKIDKNQINTPSDSRLTVVEKQQQRKLEKTNSTESSIGNQRSGRDERSFGGDSARTLRRQCSTEEGVLNNGKLISKGKGYNLNDRRTNDPLMEKSYRIQNDTQGSKQLGRRRSSVRRSSSVKVDSGASSVASNLSATSHPRGCYYNNGSTKYYFDRKNSLRLCDIRTPNNRRRMSSFDQAYHKQSPMSSIRNLEIKALQDEINKGNLDKTSNAFKIAGNSTDLPDKPSSTIGDTPKKKSKGRLKQFFRLVTPYHFVEDHEMWTLYIFPEHNRFRQCCTWFVNQKWFDNVILLFIALNCITLAMERPNIPPNCTERYFLSTANYVFTAVFAVEMFIKVVSAGLFYGRDAYFTSGWNIMDGSLVIISIVDLLMSIISESSPRIFGILRVFRLLRSLRPLRVINRAPGLKLVVQTLLSSLRPIGNIVLICCTFFIIFGILGVQLFKGTFYYCEGENIKGVRNKSECLSIEGNVWINRKYNFDDLGKALMSLFVLSSRDGWVNIMYTGLDAVGVDQQPIVNYNEWRLLYFIAFILLVGFFVLNMFVGVVVENFHRCREEQEKEEKIRRAAKRALQMEKKRKRMHEPPYYTNYSPLRMFIHNVVTSKYFDLAIAAVIGLNVVTMAMEYYMMPLALEYALKIFNYFFTAVFILEAAMKLLALGAKIYLKDRWNQLDVAIVILSIVGIVLEELETNIIPINPTIIRVMRVLRIARVLKLLKMAKGIRALLDTVMQALPQVGNLGLLFFLLFFIFAALGVELFGRLECSEEVPCQGLGEHAHFANFGMAFLTLFRVATGDNWNGIMKDTLRDDCDDAADCVKNCCVSTIIAPIFFVIFVLMAQFVLVNVVVAVLMKHLEESHKQMEDELDIETELEREFEREQEFEEEQALCMQLNDDNKQVHKRPLTKVSSLPSNFTYSTPILEKKSNIQRRQTIQYFNQNLGLSVFNSYTNNNSYDETAENNINGEGGEGEAEGEATTEGEGLNSIKEYNSKNVNKKILINKTNLFSKSLDGRSMAATIGGGSRSLAEEGKRKSSLLLDGSGRVLKGAKDEGFSITLPAAGIDAARGDAVVGTGKGDDSSRSAGDVSATGGQHLAAELADPVESQSSTITSSSKSNNRPSAATALATTGSRKLEKRQLSLDYDLRHRTSSVSEAKNECTLLSADGGLSAGTIGPSACTIGTSATTMSNTSNSSNSSNTVSNKSFLSVPKLQPKSRSGSTKQLFKQTALDEDGETNDESSLLLPVATAVDSGCGANHCQQPPQQPQQQESNLLSLPSEGGGNGFADTVKNSESCEIIRIISERRKI